MNPVARLSSAFSPSSTCSFSRIWVRLPRVEPTILSPCWPVPFLGISDASSLTLVLESQLRLPLWCFYLVVGAYVLVGKRLNLIEMWFDFVLFGCWSTVSVCLIIHWIYLIEARTGHALFAFLVRGKVQETRFLDLCHFIFVQYWNTCIQSWQIIV